MNRRALLLGQVTYRASYLQRYRRGQSLHTERTLQPSEVPQTSAQNMQRVKLSVDKSRALVDEPLAITVRGLQPASHVTLVATASEKSDFFSYATFVADARGEVDVCTCPAMAGTYTGRDAMGLIWSMIQQPGQDPGRRLMKLDVTSPLVTRFSAYLGQIDGKLALEKTYAETFCVATVKCERWYMGNGVRRQVLEGGRLNGTFFMPPGDGPFPCVIDMFGTAGGTVEYRSALLASRGIAALSLCYFLPELVTDMEYFTSAIDWVLSQERILQAGVGVLGVSKGADVAYLLAAVSPKVLLSVNIGGSDRTLAQPHTYQGVTFPFDQRFSKEVMKVTKNLRPGDKLAFTPHLKDYLSKNTSDEFTIPVERARNAHFLIIHGGDDQCVPSSVTSSISRRLDSRGKSNHTVIVYPDAGHLIEPPFSPHCGASYNNYFQTLSDWGGNAKAHAHAQEDSWKKILQLIGERIGPFSVHDVTPNTPNRPAYMNNKL